MNVERLPIIRVAVALLLVMASTSVAQPNPEAIRQDLKSFSHLATVLMVAAHPDDENTQLITYLSLGRGYRMGYLSITRGDGGQNVLGPEFGAELGAIRTQELLAARRIDGGRQFFTRAIDFGFSKDYKETLGIWDHQQVLGDVVRVIRQFRPDVMVTRFSTVPGNTHGHHTSSAILAVEAFKLAGDPKAFPEQLAEGLTLWQPRRIFYNGFGAGIVPSSQMVPGAADTKNALRIDIGGTDPVTGESFGTLAAKSRSQHKTQGFGDFANGPGRGGNARPESFQLLGGEPATKDIMDGIDLTWARVKGGDAVVPLIDDAIAKFDAHDPSKSVPSLLEIRAKVVALPADPVVADKRKQLDRILADCLGLSVQTLAEKPSVCPGESVSLTHTAVVTSSVPLKWNSVRDAPTHANIHPVDMTTGIAAERKWVETVPADAALTQPYWLAEPGTVGMFRVSVASLIGRPESPPAVVVQYNFEVGGQTLTLTDEPVDAKSHRRLEIVPPVSLKTATDVQLFAPGSMHDVEVDVTGNSSGTLQLTGPASWNISPANQPFKPTAAGEHAKLIFNVTAPAIPASAELTARATINGRTYDNQRIEIAYSHIPPILLQPPATVKAVALNMQTRGKNVGYIDGAGDSVADAIRQMGYSVTTLNADDFTLERFKTFDAVVIGVRALNVRKDLAGKMKALFDYAAVGGTVIEQYNRPNGLLANNIAPYDLRISSLRVTDETAPIKFLAPDHPALNTPNKITAADFDGWVQERGIYYPDQWDSHFTPILSCSDPGEAPLDGGLLIAQHGKGYFVYTGLVFFRQLPAGNPGAFRLFANLLSLGQRSMRR